MTNPDESSQSLDEIKAERAVDNVRTVLADLRGAEHDRAELDQLLTVRLRAARDAGVSMPELAELTGFTRQYLYRRLKT